MSWQKSRYWGVIVLFVLGLAVLSWLQFPAKAQVVEILLSAELTDQLLDPTINRWPVYETVAGMVRDDLCARCGSTRCPPLSTVIGMVQQLVEQPNPHYPAGHPYHVPLQDFSPEPDHIAVPIEPNGEMYFDLYNAADALTDHIFEQDVWDGECSVATVTPRPTFTPVPTTPPPPDDLCAPGDEEWANFCDLNGAGGDYGFCVHVCRGEYPNLGSLDNVASYLDATRLPLDAEVCLYDGANFTGDEYCLQGNFPYGDLAPLGWDNRTSSIIIRYAPPPPLVPIEIYPSHHDFGSIPIGSDSTWVEFRIMNESDAAVSIDSIDLVGGNPADFVIATGDTARQVRSALTLSPPPWSGPICMYGTSLNPEENCIIFAKYVGQNVGSTSTEICVAEEGGEEVKAQLEATGVTGLEPTPSPEPPPGSKRYGVVDDPAKCYIENVDGKVDFARYLIPQCEADANGIGGWIVGGEHFRTIPLSNAHITYNGTTPGNTAGLLPILVMKKNHTEGYAGYEVMFVDNGAIRLFADATWAGDKDMKCNLSDDYTGPARYDCESDPVKFPYPSRDDPDFFSDGIYVDPSSISYEEGGVFKNISDIDFSLAKPGEWIPREFVFVNGKSSRRVSIYIAGLNRASCSFCSNKNTSKVVNTSSPDTLGERGITAIRHQYFPLAAEAKNIEIDGIPAGKDKYFCDVIELRSHGMGDGEAYFYARGEGWVGFQKDFTQLVTETAKLASEPFSIPQADSRNQVRGCYWGTNMEPDLPVYETQAISYGNICGSLPPLESGSVPAREFRDEFLHDQSIAFTSSNYLLIDGALRMYNPISDTVVESKNLLADRPARLITAFSYNFADLPADVTATFQLSQDGVVWRNALMAGVITETAILTGEQTIVLSELGWGGSSFYYRLVLTSGTGGSAPKLDSIMVSYLPMLGSTRIYLPLIIRE